MALIKCKECAADISENAGSCPKCGSESTGRRSRIWINSLNAVSGTFTAVFGTLVIPAAGAVLAWYTFVYQKNAQENEKLQAMVQSAVSQDAAKELTAIRVVSYLAKLHKVPASFALSVLGTVARNGENPKLRREAYDAIENLTTTRSSFDVESLDTYDKLEVFCLKAALTPSQYFRQVNLHYIEKYATDEVLGHEVASKLLSFSQDVSDPQTKIDLLLSVFIRYNDPDMTQSAIPILYGAVKERDPSGSDSNEDVLKFLEGVPYKDDRSQIRLYLACALVTNDQHSCEDYLKKFAQIGVGKRIRDEARRLVNGVAKTAKDNPMLVRILDLASKNLAGEIDKNTADITQR